MNLDLKFFKKIKWYKISQYNDCILMKYLQFDCERNKLCKKEIKHSYRYQTILNFDDIEYFDFIELRKINDYLEKRFRKDKKFFHKYSDFIHKNCKICVNYSKKLKSINPEKYTSKEIAIFFDKYITTILKIMPFVNTPTFFQNFLLVKLRNYLEKKNIEKRKIAEILLKITEPSSEPFSFKEKRKLMELALEINKRKLKIENLSEDIKKKIQLHQKKYVWMGIIFMRGKVYPIDHFLKRLKEFLKKDVKKELKGKGEREKNIKKLIKKYNITKENLYLLNILRNLAFLRTYQIDMINISNYNALNFLKDIAKKINLSYEDMLFLIPPEIGQILVKKKKFHNEINERKKGWAMVLYKDKLELITEKKYNLIKNKIFAKDYSKIDSVKGMIAYKGKVVGKVFLAMNSAQLKNITKEDILIAPETTVDFEIAMEKVKAIITDRGGILSHAAIVSREFKKPCIVGTNIATKVFKTGDKIEVDANKGIVKKVKRK